MNIMMVAAAQGQGINPGVPASETSFVCLFLAVSGVMLLTAAALLVRREEPKAVRVRYARSRRATNGL